MLQTEPFFEVKPTSPWVSGWSIPTSPKEPWHDDVELKKAFGISLGKDLKPFPAALEVFPKDTSKALWAANYWLSDPVVIAARDIYAEAVETQSSLLDKTALSVKLLKFAEEKDQTGRFYVNEAKDRLAAFKLYAEVQGYIGKIDINASTNTITNNKLELVIVKSPNKEERKETIIEAETVEEIQPKIPLNLKLVSSPR